MRTGLMALSTAAALLVPALEVQGQQPQGVSGMFGPRLLGRTLRPMPRTVSGYSRGGLSYGRSGQFNGIDADSRRLMFGGLPWQYRPVEVPLPQVGKLPVVPALPAVPGQYQPPPMAEPQQQFEVPMEAPPMDAPRAEVLPGEPIPGGEQAP